MTVYGETGYIECINGTDMRLLLNEKDGPQAKTAPALPEDVNDPFALLAKVCRSNNLPDNNLSSLSNNYTVMRILDAAKAADASGCAVEWSDMYK